MAYAVRPQMRPAFLLDLSTLDLGAPGGAGVPYGAWASVAVVGGLAVGIVGLALLIVRLVTRVVDKIHDSRERLSTYECGEAPVGSAWFRFNNRFTTVALTFLIFDVELALLWPILPRCLGWIGAGQGWLVFAEVAAFTGTLALGLAWVARMGGFVWDRVVEAPLLDAPLLEATVVGRHQGELRG